MLLSKTITAFRRGPPKAAKFCVAAIFAPHEEARRFWKILRQWCVLIRPLVLIDMKRPDLREVMGSFRASNLRVFGSVLHRTDRDGSDPDLQTPDDLPQNHRVKVFAEALPALPVRLWRVGTEKP